MVSESLSESQTEQESPKPHFWLKRSHKEGLVVLDRSSPRFDDDLQEYNCHEPSKQLIKHIIRKTASYVSRSKSRKSSPILGPLTYNEAFFTKDVNRGDKPGGVQWSDDYLRKLYTKLESGIILTKVSRKKQVEQLFFVKGGVLSWRDTKNIDLDSIKDVRTGDMAKNYIEDYKASQGTAQNWVTIIYQTGTKFRALHLVAHSPADYECLYVGIVSLVDTRRHLMRSITDPEDEMFANVHWRASVSAEKAADDIDVLSFQDVEDLCAKFNIFCSRNHLRRLFDLADINGNGLLNFTEFQCFVQELKARPELNRIWLRATRGSEELHFEEFQKFVTKNQHESWSASKIMNEFERFGHSNGKMRIDGFRKFLASQPYLHDNETDYSLPISKYFISSSHNTYLQGKQLAENPTVETYVHALQQGCRCIEIDVWDSDEGPVVCHGKLTGSLPLENVIKVVRKYAFIASPYPLVLSLEVHCKLANQILMERTLRKELGSNIINHKSKGMLMSPTDLRHTFLVKVKKSKSEFKSSQDEDFAYTSSTSSSYDSDIEVKRRSGRRLSISKKMHVIDSLVSMSFIHGLKFRNFSLPESKTENHCFSLNEKKLENLIKDESQKLAVEKHNRRFLMRVYPHAFRYKSSNFNPIKFWELGVQMVATNWQTFDLGQQLNKAMFQLPLEEGPLWHSGYVLKPEFLLNSVAKAGDIQVMRAGLDKRKIVLRIEILSAQMLPKPKDFKQKQAFPNFSVNLNVYSNNKPIKALESDNGIVLTETSGSTSNCSENGVNPIWETRFKITLDDSFFNFMLFKVRAGDTELATCCSKLDYLRRGYRHLPLYNESGERYMFSTLFIRVDYNYE
ncbi:LAME_0D11144g1_1 [Lachancea meyersii CBS 8951]|uniref:Phosphoinositide phospholipase C n=1 Tax=Lachancea meyersii CBS 8951 TaxID=1266667 RepID=A0A1G4JCH9_9SACH|nr:LAME_0D11144g1_1 [Lachancea meyersii CBS 8951]